MSELIKWLRAEADRNARMQGDKEHQTNRRRKTFRGRNHRLTEAADRITALETELDKLLKLARMFAGKDIGMNSALDDFEAAAQEEDGNYVCTKSV